MGNQRVRQLQRQAAPPKTATPAPKPFSWQRPFPVPAHEPAPSSSEPIPDLQARLDVLRRANPDWSKVKFDSAPAKPMQAKLTVGAPNDQYEQEADRVADQVMSMPDAATQQPVQRETMPEEDEVQTKPLAASITPLVQREAVPEEEEIQTKALAQPLDQRIASIQREEMPEEEESLQMKSLGSIQREDIPEEEEIQTKSLGSIQREEMPEEEESLQMKSLGSIQREEMPEEEEIQTKRTLQRSSDGNLQAGGAIENRLNNSQGGGRPLPNDVHSFMEPRFGADFSQVRVHTGSESVQMNRDLNAQAFTHKQDVYFGAGKAPAKDALTAHELTHVVQQTGVIQRVPQIQREEPAPAQDLNQQYEAAKNSGDWVNAAKYLNGFSRKDILTRLGWDSAQLGAIHKGASNNPEVGPESQVARLAKVRYLDVNFKAAMKAGSWKIAAEYLNGFNSSDIITRLAKLKPEVRAQLKRGALDGGYPAVTKEILEEPTPAEPSNNNPPQDQTDVETDISQMGRFDKLGKAIQYGRQYGRGDLSAEVEGLFSKQSLFAIGFTTGLFVVAQATPAGWFADACLLTGASISGFFAGSQVSQFFNHLKGFVSAANATTKEELEQAGHEFSQAVMQFGAGFTLFVLTHTAKGASQPYDGPPPPKMVDAIAPDIGVIRIPQEGLPENVAASKGGGNTKSSNVPQIRNEDITTGPHGPERPLQTVASRVWQKNPKTGKINGSQGRWLSREAAEKAVKNLDASKMQSSIAYSVEISSGSGQVVRPGSTSPEVILEAADRAAVIIDKKGKIHTFPIGSEHPAYGNPAPTTSTPAP